MTKPDKIMVYPARPGMNLCHPTAGPLPDAGKRWPLDTFTRRRIADGGISEAALVAPVAQPADALPEDTQA